MSIRGRTRLVQWVALAMILGGPVAGIPCYLAQAQLHIPVGLLPTLGCILLAVVGPGILVRVLAVIPFVIVAAAIGYADVPASALTTHPYPDTGPVFEILLVCGAFVFAWLWAIGTNVVALVRARKHPDAAGTARGSVTVTATGRATAS